MKKLLVLLLFAIPLFGQTYVKPFVQGGVGTSRNMGYQNPDVLVSGGVEVETMSYLAVADGTFHSANKQDAKSGFSTGVRGQGFYRKLAGDEFAWLAGGGLALTELHTKAYNKTVLRAQLGGGFECTEYLRFMVLATVPLSDPNYLRGVTLDSKWWTGKEHWYVVPSIALNHFRQAGKGRNGSDVSIGVRYEF